MIDIEKRANIKRKLRINFFILKRLVEEVNSRKHLDFGLKRQRYVASDQADAGFSCQINFCNQSLRNDVAQHLQCVTRSASYHHSVPSRFTDLQPLVTRLWSRPFVWCRVADMLFEGCDTFGLPTIQPKLNRRFIDQIKLRFRTGINSF